MNPSNFSLMALFLLLTSGPLSAYQPHQNPIGDEAWWWQDDWWEAGQLPTPENHPVVSREIEYPSGDATVPATLFRPDDKRRYPAVLFQHGRRGLDDLLKLKITRLAARGFVVLAPDVFSARFIEKLPLEHDYAVEGDTARGIDVLLGLPDVSTDRACVASHTRGGYMTLKALTTHGRQLEKVACYLSWYPHLQDPNAPEPMQVYRYAPEVDQLRVPVLVFIGDQEQYQRRRSIETAMDALRDAGRDAQLIIYPGVGRGFDFRPPIVRSFADDLAEKDAIQRAATFIRQHLSTHTITEAKN